MKVTVYSLPDCPKCDKLKEYLKKRGIDFDARWFDTEAQTEFIMMNMFGNPPIITAGSAVRPSEEMFEGYTLREDKVAEVLENG
ncbi:MAG TPA: glutaredoxin family protein [Candidatus Bathyarchaeia archaeon]